MANTLNKTGITNGNTVEAYHVTQSIDAFTGTVAYDISLSGSLGVTGPLTITGPTNRYIAKGLSIPSSSSVELVKGGAKFVMQNTDILKVQSDTATSADVYVSVVDSISA